MNPRQKRLFFMLLGTSLVVVIIVFVLRDGMPGAVTDHAATPRTGTSTHELRVSAQNPSSKPVLASVVETASASATPAKSDIAGADYGSADSQASAEFQRALTCHTAANTIDALTRDLNYCQSIAQDPKSRPWYDKCLVRNQDAGARLQAASSRLAACNSIPAQRENALFDAVVKAAKAGDLSAQVCYVDGSFDRPASDAELAQYKIDAQEYSKAALERGDWRIVELLATPSNSLAHGGAGMKVTLPIGTTFEAYRMNRLMRLGADETYGRFLDGISSTGNLKPRQIALAQAWAKQEYAQYFANSPRLMQAPVICGN